MANIENRKEIERFIYLTVNTLQEVAFQTAKGYLSDCKRLPFRLQKHTFCSLKGRLLQSERKRHILPRDKTAKQTSQKYDPRKQQLRFKGKTFKSLYDCARVIYH